MTIIGVIIFRKKKNNYEFLLLKRVPAMGGFWQFAGGSQEEGESKIDAAYREVLEETGINKTEVINIITGVYEFSVDKHYLTNKPISPLMHFIYAFEVNPDVKIDLSNNPDKEHEEYCWITYDKIIPMLKWENNKEAFYRIKKILKIK